MGDWDVVSSSPDQEKPSKVGGEWDVASHDTADGKPPKSLTDRISNAWENATPGGPMWLAREAVRGVRGAVEGSKAAVAPQVGTEADEFLRRRAEEEGPGHAMAAAGILAPTTAPGGGLFAVPRGAAAEQARAAAALRPPPLPVEPPPPVPAAAIPPRQVMRPDAGVDLLPHDVPHQLPTYPAAGADAPGGPLHGVSPETVEWLRSLGANHYNPNTLDDRLAEMSAHQFLGEINPLTEQHMRGLTSRGGPGRLEVVGSASQRAAEKPERMRSTFNRAFGENENVAQLNRLIDIDKQNAASPLYQQFRSTPIPPSPEVNAIVPRLRAAGALQAANKALAEEGLPATHGFVEGEAANAFNEGADVTRVPTAAAFDYAKQHIDTLISKAMENGDSNAARRYTQMKNDLDAALEAHPTAGRLWQIARQAYEGPTSRQTAMKFGQRILTNNVDADELPFLTSGYTDAQMQSARIGMRKYLEDTLNNKREIGADVYTKTLSPNNVAKIRWMIGDRETDAFVHAMEREFEMHGAPNRLYGNSQTEFTRQANEAAKNRATVQESPVGLSDVFHPVKAAGKLATKAAEKAFSAKRQADVDARIARIDAESAPLLTSQGPQRDAIARHLWGNERLYVSPPRARGGKVSPRAKAENKTKRAAGGAVNRALRAAKGYAEGGAADAPFDDGAMMPETYVNPAVKAGFGNPRNLLSNLGNTARPDQSGEHVRYTTASPLVNITDEDIDRGIHVGMGAGPASIKAGAIPQAAETGPVWRSAVEDAIASSPMKAAPADQWAGTLRNSKGIKPEEMDWLGVNDFLASRNRPGANRVEPVTKQELLDHLAGNRLELKDVTRADIGDPHAQSILDIMSPKLIDEIKTPADIAEAKKYNSQFREHVKGLSDEEILASVEKARAGKDFVPTKFSSYQLPGGENYREHLITMPTKDTPKSERMTEIEKQLQSRPAGEEDKRAALRAEYKQLADETRESPSFKSAHWDEPNVLAHVRSNEREVEGVPSLHIEEIQSDWHQKGRKQGYRKEQDSIKSRDVEGVPDAPFKSTDQWSSLALKRMIRQAAEEGKTRISWTPGEAQAARYDLSKHIDKLLADPERDGTFTIIGRKNNGNVMTEKHVPADKVADYVGKDAAEKLMKADKNKYGMHELEGVDLKVGGEGMREFYDKMLPKAVEKIGKQHGVKVKQGEIPYPGSQIHSEVPEHQRRHLKVDNKDRQLVHYFDIPESLKKAALSGQSMFHKGGRVMGRKSGGAAAHALSIARKYKS